MPCTVKAVGHLSGWAQRGSVCALALLTGCLSLPPEPPLDLSAPDWTVRQGQAVWHVKSDASEIAGELLVATHPDGRSLVQFTKPPLPFVTAQRTTNRWQVQFLAQKKSYAAAGRPPARILWLHLPDALVGRSDPSQWSFRRETEGRWHFENRANRESLDGFLHTTRLPPSHFVRPGETLAGVAVEYGITPDSIEAANAGAAQPWWSVGRVVRLPALPGP